ncbi:glycosyltransferase [Allobranchiibius huperziae]|uniref:Cellulose synthase/poly-beta-1,6-N-acetylglucosamine synthase-like glycosyltransferase n=1 Tax=Allobranchiibius huperziae TaxID=1874116 RepID=A0A853DH12_9MICO|nr:glycosyltransferase family 2 protein [Allobranchiibius huperziae]NYJ76068.1 cellulose synthase/poly-beta-1,6-N-acetylglucosamine synthase-like glycosyltransferase [Allobranchiibius huperziae]
MRALLAVVTAYITVKVAVGLSNSRSFPVLDAAATSTGGGDDVSLIVPVRDEMARLPPRLPGMLAQKVRELIFLDDCSTDGTTQLLHDVAAEHPHVRVVQGRPMPDGWVGKTWACSQGAEAALGDVLVFCDADISLGDGAIDAVLGQLHAQRADLMSVFPRQVTKTFAEHVTMPLIDDLLLTGLPFQLLEQPRAKGAAAANGSIMAFPRASYDALGGFAAVRTEIVEDLAMARHTRRTGHRLGLALGGDLISTRMYEGFDELVAGLGKGLLAVMGNRPLLVVYTAWHLLAYTVPPFLIRRQPAWAIPWALAVAERLVVEATTGRREWWQSLTMPLTPLYAIPVAAVAVRRTKHWKGRTYP